MFPVILGFIAGLLEVSVIAAEILTPLLGAELATTAAAAGTAFAVNEAGKELDQRTGVKKTENWITEHWREVLNYFVTNDPRHLLPEEQRKYIPPKYVPSYLNENIGGTQPGKGLIKKDGQGLIKKDGTQPEQGLVVKPKIEDNDNDEQLIITGSTNVQEPLTNFVPPVDKDPRSLGRLIIDFGREFAKSKSFLQAVKSVVERNPSSYGLMKAIIESKGIPEGEEYQKIASVYNGRNIDFSNFSMRINERGLVEVTGIDETGTAFSLEQTTGVVFPAVAGTTFMGPRSPNNKLPAEGRVEDYFSFFHDYRWHVGGNFDRLGDLQYISRMSQNMDRVLPENRLLVTNTILYFTNVSLTIGSLRNGNFYNEVISEKPTITGGEPSDAPSAAGEQYFSLVENEMDEYQRSDGFFTNYRRDLPEQLLNDLEIVLN